MKIAPKNKKNRWNTPRVHFKIKQAFKENKLKITRRILMTLMLNISFIFTFNIIFGIFIWNIYDTSPNIALAFISLLVILANIYSLIKLIKLKKLIK